MTGLGAGVRQTVRSLLRNPALAGISVVALALGIGLTTMMFSIVYGALMRGLPYEDGDRIMDVNRTRPSQGVDYMGVTIHDYASWAADQTSFGALAALYEGTVNMRGTERAERYDGAFVTANTFSALGVRPALGRGFRDEEDDPGAPTTVVLAHHVWEDRFDADPEVVGQTVVVNGEAGEIIGVMPEGFRFPHLQDVWLPLRMDPVALEWGTGRTLSVFGKLGSGRSVDEALAELSGISARLAREYSDTNEGVFPTIRPFTEASLGGEAKGLLWTMLGAVSLVLLIACANVANLLLARAAVRTREVGVRTALGAGRLRVVAGMVGEALVLALVGGLVGTALAWVGITLFSRAIASTEPPFWLHFGLDGPILLFVVALTAVATLLAGLLPALKASGMPVAAVLKDESRGSSSLRIGRLSRGLVVAEIAMSAGLLVAAGLMIRSVVELGNFDYGFDRAEVITARVGIFETDFPTEEERGAFFRDVERRMREIPGVTASALGTGLPGRGSGSPLVAIEGRSYAEERDYPRAREAAITPGYFEVFGVAPVRGRDFEALDGREALRVAVVNESFVRSHFPDGALGRRFRPNPTDETSEWRTVVGVVPDLLMQGVGNSQGDPAGYYVPLAQSDAQFVSLAARGPANPMELAGPMRDAVAAVHADAPLYWVETLDDRLEQGTWIYGVFGTLFAAFGAAALFLASVGLYGVMSFSVGRRTPELGIRMALGADSGRVLALILRQGMGQILLGLAVGLVLAFILSRGIQSLLFEVSPSDPLVLGLIIGVLALTGLTASMVPAWRAARVSPVEALRYE